MIRTQELGNGRTKSIPPDPDPNDRHDFGNDFLATVARIMRIEPWRTKQEAIQWVTELFHEEDERLRKRKKL